MINIRVEFSGTKQLENLIRYIENDRLFFEAQNLVNDLADNAVEEMRDIITTSKKRKSLGTNLEDSITKEILNDVGGIDVGIGNIAKLKTDAPYWEVLNNGGYVPYSTRKGAPLGSFEGYPPDGVGGNQNWERSGNKGFFMKPKNPIEGIDYIGKAIRGLDLDLRNSIDALLKEYTDNLSKMQPSGLSRAGRDKYQTRTTKNISKWGKNVTFYKSGGVDMG